MCVHCLTSIMSSKPAIMATMADFSCTDLVSRPKQKNAQQRAVQDGSDGEAGFEHRSPVARDQSHQEQNHAPRPLWPSALLAGNALPADVGSRRRRRAACRNPSPWWRPGHSARRSDWTCRPRESRRSPGRPMPAGRLFQTKLRIDATRAAAARACACDRNSGRRAAAPMNRETERTGRRSPPNWRTAPRGSVARLGGQQPLDQQLLGSVARSGEEAAADQSRPKAVVAREEFGGPGKAEIEHLEFVRRAPRPRCTCAQPPGI